VRTHGLALLPWQAGAEAYRQRAIYAGLPFDDESLLSRLDEWLPPLVAGRRRLDAIPPGALGDALRGLLNWDEQQRRSKLLEDLSKTALIPQRPVALFQHRPLPRSTFGCCTTNSLKVTHVLKSLFLFSLFLFSPLFLSSLIEVMVF
jgi:HrpA-like RNA helicase